MAPTVLGIKVEQIRANVFYSTFSNVFYFVHVFTFFNVFIFSRMFFYIYGLNHVYLPLGLCLVNDRSVYCCCWVVNA